MRGPTRALWWGVVVLGIALLALSSVAWAQATQATGGTLALQASSVEIIRTVGVVLGALIAGVSGIIIALAKVRAQVVKEIGDLRSCMVERMGSIKADLAALVHRDQCDSRHDDIGSRMEHLTERVAVMEAKYDATRCAPAAAAQMATASAPAPAKGAG